MPGALLASLDVGYQDVAAAVQDQEIRLAGEDGDVAAEAETVLVLDADVVAALEPEVALLVEQDGVVGQPLGLIEVGGGLCPTLVVGFEPGGPLAAALAGEQAGQPSGPDVGEVPAGAVEAGIGPLEGRWSLGVAWSLSPERLFALQASVSDGGDLATRVWSPLAWSWSCEWV